MAQHWGRRGANLSENEGARSECKKSGENSRQMAPVSTICDEYCSLLTMYGYHWEKIDVGHYQDLNG